jgi:SAM-dependent methyltransferase
MGSASQITSSVSPTTDFSALAGLLYCPDDGEMLVCAASRIACDTCGRKFTVFEDGVIELLPRRPMKPLAGGNDNYWWGYLQEFGKPYRLDESAIAWGAPEACGEDWMRKRLRQVEVVRPLAVESGASREQVFCDIAAGAGNYSLSYASHFKTVLHCDLSVENLNYSVRKARRLGIRNIFFLRIDYFSPPFYKSLDRIVCLDTLVRGERHEVALLGSIGRTLKYGGQAVVDFHNWWHNPLRRLGLLRQNFVGNRSYRRRDIEQLLPIAGISNFEYFPFHQEFDSAGSKRRLLSYALPSTRLLYRFESTPHCSRVGLLDRELGPETRSSY